MISFESRKIFNFDDLDESKVIHRNQFGKLKGQYPRSVSAAGVLFYRVDEHNRVKLLVIEYADRDYLDDLGGKVDLEDPTLDATIAREVAEESNGILGAAETTAYHAEFYNHASKYCVRLVRVDEGFHNDTSIFGDHEGLKSYIRRLVWMDFEAARGRLAHRLRIPSLLAFLGNPSQFN